MDYCGNKDSLQIGAIDSRAQFMFRQLYLFNKVLFIRRHRALWSEFFMVVVIAFECDTHSDNHGFVLLLFIYLFTLFVCLFVFQNGVCGWENANELVHFSTIQIPQGKLAIFMWIHCVCLCVTTYSGLGGPNVIIKNQPLKYHISQPLIWIIISNEKRSFTFKVI